MIEVTYLPADDGNLGYGKKARCFPVAGEFYTWLKSWVCKSCAGEYEPKTVSDYMSTGCGCEIDVEDPKDMIDWERPI